MHYESVWGKQTPGWRLSALTVLLVKFLSWLPTLVCHSSTERRKKMNADWWASEEQSEHSAHIFISFYDKNGEENRKCWQNVAGTVREEPHCQPLCCAVTVWRRKNKRGKRRSEAMRGLLWVRRVRELFEALKECSRVGPSHRQTKKYCELLLLNKCVMEERDKIWCHAN